MSGVVYVIGVTSAGGNGTKTVTASCAVGKIAISGGYAINLLGGGGSEPPFITRSERTSGTTWTITATQGSITSNYNVTAHVLCIDS